MTKIEESAENYAKRFSPWLQSTLVEAFTKGAEEASKVWKDAQGSDLPELDREVIVLQKYEDEWRVCFAHRPNKREYVEINGEKIYPDTYGKGGWNLPDVRYWLDVELPETEES